MVEAQSDIFAEMKPIPELALLPGEMLDDQLKSAKTPFIIRGLVKDWPLVQAGLRSAREARAYLLSLRQDRPFVVSVGSEEEGNRLFYQDDMTMNFDTGRAKLPEVFARIEASENAEKQPIIYMASIDVHDFFPGLHEANHVDLGERNCLASIWMGTRTRIAAHNDFPDNLACAAVGRRRFTLFPPDQFSNLYLGPPDNTPAGRAVSMVDFHRPDYDKYPKFKQAVQAALVAELAAGDAVFIPSMWWHHVEGLDPFNVLVNYWWRDTPRHLGQPQDVLNHAMMSIRDLPADEKQHWRDLFDHYVFNNGDNVTEHVPNAEQSIIGPMTPENSKKIRTYLLRALSQ